MFRPLRAEAYRMWRRTMPRVLLALVALFAFAMYELVYTTIRAQLTLLRGGNVPANAGGQDPQALMRQLEETLVQLQPQHVSDFGVSLVAGVGAVMLIVYAASHVGNEFGWGTLRTLLASGLGRDAFLATKLASLAIFAVALTVIGVVAVALASYVVAAQSGNAGTGLDAAKVLSSAWRTAYSFMPYLALSALIALWSRSSAAGIAFGLVIYFVENIATSLLISFNRDFATVANLGIARNVSSLSRVTVTVAGQNGPDPATTLPSQEQAALMLALWTAVFMALAFWRLRTRDVTLA